MVLFAQVSPPKPCIRLSPVTLNEIKQFQQITNIFCTRIEIKRLKLVRVGDSRGKLRNVASDFACVSKYI
jgi:hypothetical protein